MKSVSCPHCGTALDTRLADEESRLKCGQCGRQLKLARKRDLRSQETGDKPEKASRQPSGILPSASPPAAEKSPTHPGAESLLPPPALRRPLPNLGAESTKEKAVDLPPVIALESRPQRSAEEVLVEAARKKAASRRWAALGFTGFVVACLAALYVLLNPPPRTNSSDAVAAAVPAAPTSKEPSSTQGEPNSQLVAEDSGKAAKAEEPVSAEAPNPTGPVAAEPVKQEQPIAWGQTKSIGRRELEKLWAQLHPYLFRLSVKKAGGSKTISGVLIDSRGWLVTSLSAIEGAASIDVFPAPADPLGEPAADSIKDEIRGVLAVDRPRDLVLLQINRRLVNVVSGLQPTDKLLVPGRWLVQAAAIGPERVGWLTECRVEASEPDKFPPELQQTIARRGLDLTPYWPQHGTPLASGVGGGLFTEDGRLAGINTGYGPSGAQFFVEVKLVLELAGKAKEPAVAIGSLTAGEGDGRGSTQANGRPRTADAAGASPFQVGHEAEPLAKRLAETGAACESFGWVPVEGETQFADLQAALLAFREAQELLRARQLFPKDAELLKRQVDFWTGRIKANLLSLAQDSIAEFNQRAWASLKGESPQSLVLFARVVLQPGTSPRVAGLDTATLQLLGMEQYLIATIGAETSPLLPDSEWLVVVTVDPKEETRVSPEPGQQASARRSAELREIAEVKTIGFQLQQPDDEPSEPEGDGGK